MTGYDETYAAWRADPDAWWMAQSGAIDWDRPPSRGQQGPDDDPRWFADGLVNGCHNAVDRHVAAGHGDRLAVIHDSAVTGAVTRLTYAALQDACARLAGGLAGLGVRAGDRVVIYMPMVPEALVAMLACARLGAVHCVVFGGFAAGELAKRIRHVAPKAVVAASCGIEPGRSVPYMPLVDTALSGDASIPVVVLQRDAGPADLRAGRDHDWHDVLAAAAPAGCVPVPGDHPAYILHTSGTTGAPKGVVRPTAGHLVALRWTMRAIYDVAPGEVFWAASDVGWVVGHSYICYAPLLNGNTTVMFEGKPVGMPDAGTFWRVIADHRVSAFFTAPTAIRAVKREDPDGALVARHDTTSLRALYLAGERADPDTVQWAARHLDVPVIDHWWQTETGYAIAANPAGIERLDVPTGSPGRAMPGFDVAILDDEGEDGARTGGGRRDGSGRGGAGRTGIAAGNESGADDADPSEDAHGTDGDSTGRDDEKGGTRSGADVGVSLRRADALGAVAIRLPLPPGCLSTLWQADARFRTGYLGRFPGWYETGDAGRLDPRGNLWIMARTDDVINVAGHRLSAGAMEEVLADHPDIAECAVFAVLDDVKGHVPMGLVCLNRRCTRPATAIANEAIAMMRDRIGPVAAFRLVAVVDRLPKTRSGKTLRATMAQIADGADVAPPATIDDPAILDEVRAAMATLGYPKAAPTPDG